MRAYLIDPEARTLSVVDYTNNICELIGAERFDAARFSDQGDVVYVDDEGLFGSPTTLFLIEGYPQPLAGKGLVVGTDAEGNDIEPTTTLDWLIENLDFGSVANFGGVLMFMGDRHRRIID